MDPATLAMIISAVQAAAQGQAGALLLHHQPTERD